MFLSVNKVKQTQEGEKKQLIQLRDILKSSLQTDQKEVRFKNDDEGFFLLYNICI